MLKYIICILLLQICINTITAQKIFIGFEGGVATYSMSGLKEINTSIFSQVPFKVKTVDNFPPTIYYRPFVSIQIDKFRVGFMHTYTSTGSRLSAMDYSGEYRFDMIASAHSPSLHADIKLTKNSAIECYFRLLGGLNFTELKMEEYFMLDTKIVTDEDYRFKSINLFLEPSFRVEAFYKNINFSFNFGYHSVYGDNALHLEEDSEMKLQTPDEGTKIRPRWSGVRIGLGISYSIH